MSLAFTAFIKTKGYTTKGALADACGMDRAVFCDRCRGRSQWFWKEVCTVCSVLDISLDDFAAYFPAAAVRRSTPVKPKSDREQLADALETAVTILRGASR